MYKLGVQALYDITFHCYLDPGEKKARDADDSFGFGFKSQPIIRL